MVPVLKNITDRRMAKHYRPVSVLSVISKIFEKQINYKLAHHFTICGLF